MENEIVSAKSVEKPGLHHPTIINKLPWNYCNPQIKPEVKKKAPLNKYAKVGSKINTGLKRESSESNTPSKMSPF